MLTITRHLVHLYLATSWWSHFSLTPTFKRLFLSTAFQSVFRFGLWLDRSSFITQSTYEVFLLVSSKRGSGLWSHHRSRSPLVCSDAGWWIPAVLFSLDRRCFLLKKPFQTNLTGSIFFCLSCHEHLTCSSLEALRWSSWDFIFIYLIGAQSDSGVNLPGGLLLRKQTTVLKVFHLEMMNEWMKNTLLIPKGKFNYDNKW